MHELEADATAFSARDAFRLYLRTGRRVPAHRIVHVKFNPNHDPTTGRFTFKNRGAAGTASTGSGHHSKTKPSTETYTIKAGDTLTHIAGTRVGLTVQDLATINGVSPDDVIKPGQKLTIPTQDALDRAKQGYDAFNALDLYMETHGGQLPPDVAHPPSVAEQLAGPGAHAITDNGYQYTIDGEGRTTEVKGTIGLNPDQTRSRDNQLEAGGDDRLPTDEGGHYIAREFDGPTEAYNHFAQDTNFNKSGYRRLENIWGAATRRGEKVHVTIESQYGGSSKRPDNISVYYTIAGVTLEADYPNRSGK